MNVGTPPTGRLGGGVWMDLYNDNDPNVAAWLRELIAAGHLPPGDVSDASIGDLSNELH